MLDSLKKSAKSVDYTNKQVLVRADLNVPVKNGEIQNDARIRAFLPTLNMLLEKKAAITILSHLGRPKPGLKEKEYSLKPVQKALEALLGIKINFSGKNFPHAGEIRLLENVRFLKGETENDLSLAKKLGEGFDIFVMDAFACAHRQHASTIGIVNFIPQAVVGPLVLQEVEQLSRFFNLPRRPIVALIGGAKITSKIGFMLALLERVDCLIIGGGMANTFLASQGYEVGASWYEAEKIPEAKRIIEYAHQKNKKLLLPAEVLVANRLSEQAEVSEKKIGELDSKDIIVDIGTETLSQYSEILTQANTIVWNGPVGLFEYKAFSEGTKKLAETMAHSRAFSLAGGGETLCALEQYACRDKIGYSSTGGGAFLAFLEKGTLPALEAIIHATGRQINGKLIT